MSPLRLHMLNKNSITLFFLIFHNTAATKLYFLFVVDGDVCLEILQKNKQKMTDNKVKVRAKGPIQPLTFSFHLN